MPGLFLLLFYGTLILISVLTWNVIKIFFFLLPPARGLTLFLFPTLYLILIIFWLLTTHP